MSDDHKMSTTRFEAHCSSRICSHLPRATPSVLRRLASKLQISTSPQTYYWGVLGISKGYHCQQTQNAASSVTDFLVWHHFIRHAKGFDHSRASFHSYHPIEPFFPDGRVIFGEAGCNRLSFPLPTVPFLAPNSHYRHLIDFYADCSNSLRDIAHKATKGDTVVLLLAGHGTRDVDGQFMFFLCKDHRPTSEIWFTRKTLEALLGDCPARIVIICTSCKSGHGALASDRWTLLCGASADRPSEALSESYSGCFRGGTFTFLEASPGHDWASTGILSRSWKPKHATKKLLRQFAWDATRRQTNFYLLKPGPHVLAFPRTDDADTPWDKLIPWDVNATAFVEMWAEPDKVDLHRKRLEEMLSEDIGCADPTGSFSRRSSEDTLVLRHPPAYIQRLMRMFSATRQIRGTFADQDRELCQSLSKRLDDLEPEPFGSEGEMDWLWTTLWSNHVLHLAFQELARAMGWWDGECGTFVVWLARDWTAGRRMTEAGVHVDKLVLALARKFNGIRTVHPISALDWLASRWEEAGCPTVSLAEWDIIVSKIIHLMSNTDIPTELPL